MSTHNECSQPISSACPGHTSILLACKSGLKGTGAQLFAGMFHFFGVLIDTSMCPARLEGFWEGPSGATVSVLLSDFANGQLPKH